MCGYLLKQIHLGISGWRLRFMDETGIFYKSGPKNLSDS